MKIRILDDSIRLRLIRSEVESIGRGERVEGRTHFVGGAVLIYLLDTGDVSDPVAALEAGPADVATVRVTLPRELGTAWATTDQVTIEAHQRLDRGSAAEGRALRLLIEKDFKCLAPRDDEDQSDAFEHPNADTAAC